MAVHTRKRGWMMICGAVLLAVQVAACEEEQGPAERLGERIDESVERVGDEVEAAADKLEEKTD